MSKHIDWDGFISNIETYFSTHEDISSELLKSLFDNYSETKTEEDATE